MKPGSFGFFDADPLVSGAPGAVNRVIEGLPGFEAFGTHVVQVSVSRPKYVTMYTLTSVPIVPTDSELGTLTLKRSKHRTRGRVAWQLVATWDSGAGAEPALARLG